MKQPQSSEILTSLHSFNSLPSLEDRSFSDQVYKIDRIIRLFKMTKNYDDNIINQIRERTNTIMRNMYKINPEKFSQAKDMIRTYINQSLSQPTSKKSQKQSSSSVSSAKPETPQNPIPSSPFGSSIQYKTPQQSNNSSSSIVKSENSKQANQKPNQSLGVKEPQVPQKKLYGNSSGNLNFQFGRKESSAQISGSLSGTFKTNINLREFCEANSAIIQQKIAINQQVITFFKTQSPDRVTLLGVQKPYDKNTDKLYICTYMQFPKQQVLSMKFKARDYQTELDQFTNVIRFPFALCVIGQSINDMKVHYVKFLLQMTSPLPLVIIYNQVAPQKSLLIRMNDKTVAQIYNRNIIEMESTDMKQIMKDKNKYKCVYLKQISIIKERCVTTKPLFRKQTKQIIENDQAIMVEKTYKNQSFDRTNSKVESSSINISSSNNQSNNSNNDNSKSNDNNSNQPAKLEDQKAEVTSLASIPMQFQYMLHAKFMTTTTPDFFIYNISQNKQLNCRKKVKSLQQCIESIKGSDQICALGVTIKTLQKKIQPQIFTNQLHLMNKCPLIIVKFKNLTLNKVSFLTVRPGVTDEELDKESITYKNIQANQCKLLHVFLSGQKGDIAKYEGKSPLQEI